MQKQSFRFQKLQKLQRFRRSRKSVERGSRIPHLVNNFRRKVLLEYLSNNDGEGEMNEIISHILLSEGKEETSKTRKSVYVSLLQTHIPKLEAENIIEFVRGEGRIVMLHLPEDVRMHLEKVEKGDIAWSYYYLLLSLITLSASLYLVNFLGAVISLLFTFSSLLNVYATTQTSG